MDAETWMNTRKAVELGFADRIGSPVEFVEAEPEPMIFSRAAVTNSLLSKIPKQPPPGISITAAMERLNLLSLSGGKIA